MPDLFRRDIDIRAQRFEYIRTSTLTRRASVPVFRNRESCSGNNESPY